MNNAVVIRANQTNLQPKGSWQENPFFQSSLLLVSISVIIGLLFGISGRPTTAAFLVIACLIPLIWQRPVIATYVLAAGAVLFETFRLHFPDSFTDQAPFFQSSLTLGGPRWIPLNGAEMILLATLLTIAIKNVAVKARPLTTGTLFGPAALLAAMTLLGLAHGITNGVNTTIANWEARPYLYLFLAYLVTFNVIKSRGEVKNILWIFLIAVALKGLIGSIRFFLVLGGDISRIREYTTYNSLMAHEESYFFALFLALFAILYLFRGDRRQLQFAAVFSPFVIFSLLANERRGGTLYLALMILVVSIFAYRLLPAYVIGVGNRSGLIAQPARAVVSIFNPNSRDASSDQYRQIENRNLKANIAIDPIIGQGYGKPMVQFETLPDISDKFIYWDTVPHNTVLWVWLRLGFIGFAALLFLIGRSIVEAGLASKYMKSSYLKGLAVFSIAGIAGWVAIGAVDMGLVNLRISILVGVLLAIIAKFRTFDKEDSSTQLEPAKTILRS